MISEFLNVLDALLLFVVVMEEFVVRVFKGGKVTVLKRLRDIFGVGDGDYVRLALVEVLKKEDAGARASPTMNIPNRKSITSTFIDVRAFIGEICPVTRTAIAPNSIICQICSLTLPILLVAIKTKTAARTITGIITAR
jgi:hypothetical protein